MNFEQALQCFDETWKFIGNRDVAVHRCWGGLDRNINKNLEQFDLHFVVCSFQTVWPRIQKLDLAGQKAAVIGLGDSKYDTDYNIESGRILAAYIESHNGELIHENLMINKCPLAQLETKVQAWTTDLNTKI